MDKGIFSGFQWLPRSARDFACGLIRPQNGSTSTCTHPGFRLGSCGAQGDKSERTSTKKKSSLHVEIKLTHYRWLGVIAGHIKDEKTVPPLKGLPFPFPPTHPFRLAYARLRGGLNSNAPTALVTRLPNYPFRLSRHQLPSPLSGLDDGVHQGHAQAAFFQLHRA